MESRWVAGKSVRCASAALTVDPVDDNHKFGRASALTIKLETCWVELAKSQLALVTTFCSSELGIATQVLDALIRPAAPPTDGLRDKVFHIDTVFSLGFVKPFPKWVFGSSEKAFGTAGMGGSFGFADPDTGVGFAYTMNRIGFHMWNDPRELALRQALFHNVLGARSQA
jgi:CubicO group peptidase (beta-lactamase class C family)